ncbi:MAG TPA: dipeptidase [Acidobacteriaceae bacterium]|jgi:acetylornithine deacetylase/succinyl-diaminopimelate desuccinylase-like protein|nr:dipeptidase [Acidobacteriaceae bacterium]
MDAAVAYARHNAARFLEELKALLRIPSVSTLPEHDSDVEAAAEWVADNLRRIGMEHVEIIRSEGHPLVYADWLHASGKPTCLCYAHYDVQPPDPLDEWVTPPFEPTERGQNLYARGAVDDKGQLVTQLKALESLFKAGDGRLPINIRVLYEGEEEVGGEQIAAFVRDHPERLKSDFALISDTEMFAPDLPTLCVGLRGMIYTELEVRGAKSDLHSGMYGGVAPNPFFALAHIIAGLKNREGTILIPGFYDAVQKPTAEELAAWSNLPFDEEAYRRDEMGAPALVGEKAYSVIERTWARPTLDVHGIIGGFIGVGAKTVIPAKATAKISMRLVPNMVPEVAFRQYKDYVQSIRPEGVSVDVRLIHSGEPSILSTDNPWIRAATRAMKTVWNKDTVFIRSGGSIPIVGDFEKHLKIPSVMMGFGLPDDGLHAPNEKFHIPNFHRGIESVIRLFEEAGGAAE